jgi:DNA modification methylase
MRGQLTSAICPSCNLHRGHRANCPVELARLHGSSESTKGDYSLEAYRAFLKRKFVLSEDFGFEIDLDELHPWLKMHQKLAVRWMIRGGRRALFASFGLGKTACQLEAVRLTLKRTGGRGLIVAPLGVRQEFAHDAKILGIDVKFIRSHEEALDDGIYLTNYESIRDEKLNVGKFNVASLDEAAILRSFGATLTFRTMMRVFEAVPYRFVATATPDPNEYLELAAYSAFLGIMEVSQTKTRFFKRDSTKADKLTIHPHKEREWWLHVASWSLWLSKPSDLGPDCSDEGYDLPPYEVIYHELPVDHSTVEPDRDGQGRLLRNASMSSIDASREKRHTLDARIAKMAEIVRAEPEEHFILWHDLEDERHAITKAIPGCVAVYGKQRASREESEKLERTILDFAEGRLKAMAAKPSMFGAGGNYQYHCARAVFGGVGFKFFQFIQAFYRIVRFLQVREVKVHIIYSESEREILKNLLDKWERHKAQTARMSEIIREYGLSRAAMSSALSRSLGIERVAVSGEAFSAVNNDCIEEMHHMETNSVHLLLSSPPFAGMYEYATAYEDFGHCDNNEHFWEQMDFLTPQMLRVLKPGRIAAIHVKDRIIPGGVNGLGFQTVYPFHVDCIRHFQKHGFAYIGMKTVVTDVVRENNQTYRLGWTEQCKDGSKMGVGMPEYLLLFRKPPSDSTNAYADEPVTKSKPLCTGENGESVPFSRKLPIIPGSPGYSRSRWQVDAHGFERSSGNRLLKPEDLDGLRHEQIFKLFRSYSLNEVYDFENHVALGEHLESKGILPVTFMLLQPQSWSPDIWTDITRMRTLNCSQANQGKDLHICAMQLDLCNRVIEQMSMPGETVLDPFGGIGSVGYCAVLKGRRAVSIELNQSYFLDSLLYLKAAEEKIATPTLFDLLAEEKAEEPIPNALEPQSSAKRKNGLFTDLMGSAMQDADEAAEAFLEQSGIKE